MSRLYEGKTFLKMRRILAVFIAPIFLFQMLSIHMLLIAVSSVRAEEISDNSAGIIQAAEEEKTDKDDLKIEEEPAKDEKLDAEKVEEVEKEQEREKDADIPAVEKDELDEENGVDSEVDTLDNKNDTEDVAVSDPVVEDEKSSESKEEESLKSEEDSLEEDKTEQPSGDQELAEENSVNDQNVVDDEKSLEEYSEGNIVPVGPAIDPEAASIEKIQPTDFIGNPLDLLEGRDDMQMSKTESMSTWSLDGNIAVTNAPVELGKKYVAPQNSEVSVTFTKLPNDPGTLTIEEIKLSPAQVKILHAASDIAYDITSSMSNGTFEYDLTLPVPRDITGSVGVKYSESISKLDSAKSVSGQIEQGSDAVDVEGMDHFTLFVVTNDSGMLSDIISSAGPNGSISPEGTMSFPVGGSITYDILPNAGYFISDVIVDGVSIGTVPSYSFTNIEISHSIQAIFAVDSTAPVINALNFAGRNGVVSGGNTVDIYVGGLTDPLGSSSIDVSEPSVFQITSPIPGLPVSLTAGNNSITIADILGVDFTAAQLMAILASTPGNTLQASGTLTDTAGNVTNITISITTDDAEPPTINTFIFANHTGIVTGGNTIDINLSGVTDADLASVGNINVSEDSTLQITSPMTNGPISLTAGDNNLGTVDVFGYNILASELRATALLYGGLIPVQGTLTDSFGDINNITINITFDIAPPTINSFSLVGRIGTITGGNTVSVDLAGVTDANLLTGVSSINISESSILSITSPFTNTPIALSGGINFLATENLFGYKITVSDLRTTALSYGGTIPLQGTLTDASGNVADIVINIAVDVTAPTINALSFANHTGIVTGGNTIDINLSGVTDADLASVGNINVSEDSTLQITSPMTNGPISLTAGDNNLGTVDVFGYNILASELRATALLYGGLIPVQGTLTDVFGNVTNIAINITVDVTAPTINALSFANRTGTVTGGNTVALDLSGVSDADLASAGSIDVSENSTLEIASPTPTGPINLTAGSNTLTTVDIFGYNILASELRATAILFGGLIPVTGTLTDENGNTTNITINILFDIVPPVITLLGSNVVDIEYGSTYIDAGATAFDDHDGDITGNIIIVNPVDTSVLGSYLVTYDVTDANGNNATQVTRTVNVVPRAITVTADSETKVFGTSDPALTYQITSGSLVGTDTFTGALTRDPGEDVGTYAITQGTLALSSNYNLTFVGNDLTITQADITVTADPQTKVYGQADPALTYQITSGGLVGTDTFTGALTRDPGEDVGTYAIKQGTLALNSNYNITFVGNFITITPAQTVIKHNHHHDDDDDNDDDDDDNDGAELFSLLPIMPQYQTGLEGGPIMSDDQSETQDQPSFVEGADAMSEDVLPPETEVPAKKFSWAWWVVIAAVIGALGWRLLRFLVARRYEN